MVRIAIHEPRIIDHFMIKCPAVFTAIFFMKKLHIVTIIALGLLTSSCGYLIEKQTTRAAQRLSDTLLDYEDPETVAAAIPTFLILVDSLAGMNDASANSRLSAAQMYGAYSGAFVTDPRRQKTLTTKALAYARQGSCQKDKKWCGIDQMDKQQFAGFIDRLTKKDVELAYAYAVAWLAYIQAHSDDWNSIADLTRAKTLLQTVVKYDEGHDHAGAHLYLAAIASSLPPSMGGQPDEGKYHFERAIELTKGRHLLAKVEYARRYARLLFDQELHHRLLTEVVEADPRQKGMTLMNTWAQQEARKLLADESSYFE